MAGMFRLAAVAAIALLVAGCGDGGDNKLSSQAESVAESSPTTTSAGPGTTSATATATGTAPAESDHEHSDDEDSPVQQTAAGRKYLLTLQKKCAALRTKRLPPLPTDVRRLRRWATVVGPVAQRTAAAVATGKHPAAVAGPIEELLAAYQQLLPLLAQIQSSPSPPGAPSDEIRQIAPLIPAALRNIQSVSFGIGVPACALQF